MYQPTRPPPRRAPALLLLVLAMGCSEPPPPSPVPLEIAVTPVVERDQPVVLDMVGETRGSSDIPIRARVEGVILSRHFTEGRKVEIGDLLYTIDPSPFESMVVEAEGYLAESRTRLAKARSDLARIRPLAEMKAVSQVDLDGAIAQFEAATGGVQASEARLEQARIELGYTKIYAPIGGRIGISEADVGEFVGKPPNPVVLNFVSRTDPIRVRFSIDERRFLHLSRRMKEIENNAAEHQGALELRLADESVHPYRGTIVATDAAVDPMTGTFTLEADFPNPEEFVVAGQFARIRASVETIENALLVPQRAIGELQGRFHVFVVGADGEVQIRPVELGAKIDRLQVVSSGLQPGDRVAVDTMRLRPGMKVAPSVVALDAQGVVLDVAAPPGAPSKPKAKDTERPAGA